MNDVFPLFVVFVINIPPQPTWSVTDVKCWRHPVSFIIPSETDGHHQKAITPSGPSIFDLHILGFLLIWKVTSALWSRNGCASEQERAMRMSPCNRRWWRKREADCRRGDGVNSHREPGRERRNVIRHVTNYNKSSLWNTRQRWSIWLIWRQQKSVLISKRFQRWHEK